MENWKEGTEPERHFHWNKLALVISIIIGIPLLAFGIYCFGRFVFPVCFAWHNSYDLPILMIHFVTFLWGIVKLAIILIVLLRIGLVIYDAVPVIIAWFYRD